MFSVGGIQSRVAVPVAGLLDLGGGLEFVEVLLFDATVVELDVGVVLDTGVVPCVVLVVVCVVLAATFVPVVPALGIPVSDVRSITPTPRAAIHHAHARPAIVRLRSE